MFSCISGGWSTRDIQILDQKKCIFIPGKPPWQLCQCIQRIPFQGWVILMSILILIWHLKPPIKKEVICSLIPRPFFINNLVKDRCRFKSSSTLLPKFDFHHFKGDRIDNGSFFYRKLIVLTAPNARVKYELRSICFNCHNFCRKFCEVSQYRKFSTSSMWHCFLANRQMWKRTPLHI